MVNYLIPGETGNNTCTHTRLYECMSVCKVSVYVCMYICMYV